MTKTRVAVLRGGPSSEYDVSMVSGREVIKALEQRGYSIIDVPISKQGEWIVDGRIKSPQSILSTVDVVFIAMHGTYGEDGTVQRICERYHVPFTGSNSFASTVAFNKDMTKRTLRDHNIVMPRHVKILPEHAENLSVLVASLVDGMGADLVIKPVADGSSYGITMTEDAATLQKELSEILRTNKSVMVEERIRGTEATVAVIEKFRNESHYALPPIEIIPPPSHHYFSADIKYSGDTTELCPGRFSYSQKETLTAVATSIHKILQLSQYSRSDFMIRGDDVYFLEVNTLPGFTPQSLYPKAADAVGLSFVELVDHLVKTAKVYS